MKAGLNALLEGKYFGKPKPQVAWKKENDIIKPSEGTNIVTTRNYTSLELFSVTRKQTGEYGIVAENASGSKTATIKLKVLGLSFLDFFQLKSIFMTLIHYKAMSLFKINWFVLFI